MARLAVESGVRDMMATPHCINGSAQKVYDSWKMLCAALREMEIPLRVFPGMEILGTADTACLLQEGKLLTLNGSRYPLIEFPFQAEARENTEILADVIRAGYRPLIAHPERYDCVHLDPGCINQWYEMGCLLQVNRGSLLGRFGGTAQEVAFALVDRGFATVVASDGHSPRMRTPWMRDVYRLLEEEFSPVAARYLLLRNPASILKNEDLPSVNPEWF